MFPASRLQWAKDTTFSQVPKAVDAWKASLRAQGRPKLADAIGTNGTAAADSVEEEESEDEEDE
jgi:hypothetical protein